MRGYVLLQEESGGWERSPNPRLILSARSTLRGLALKGEAFRPKSEIDILGKAGYNSVRKIVRTRQSRTGGMMR
jgi:hypothetical protein